MPNPIKPSLKSEIFPVALVILSILSSFYFYSVFPDTVATHWGFDGKPNGWSSKEVGAFLFPGIIFGMYFLFLLLPNFDPKKERYAEFRKTYHIFKNILLALFTLLYFVTSLNSAGFSYISVEFSVLTSIGLMFILIGNYMGKLKQNWFVGIKTPWTLSNEEVWNKTHRFGGKIFIIGGILMMLIYFVPPTFKIYLFILIIALLAPSTIFYSYFIYRKEKKIIK